MPTTELLSPGLQWTQPLASCQGSYWDLASMRAVSRARAVSHQKELAVRQEPVTGEILSGKDQACRLSLSYLMEYFLSNTFSIATKI